jgi:pimeloyl-ACP methyl ester carboxylesterase
VKPTLTLARLGRASGRATATGDDAIRAAELAAYGYQGATPRERRVGVDTGCGRVEIRITEFGGDRSNPPIVMLHGIGSATVLAASLLGHLKDRRVVAVEWPGHGLSDPCVVSPLIGIRTHAVTTLTSLLDRLQFREVDLLGRSIGAQFSLYAALDLGLRVRRIALLGAPGAAIVGVKPVPVMKALAVPVLGRALLSAPMPERTFRRNQDLVLGAGALNNVPPALTEALYRFAGRRSNPASIASFFRALIRGGSVRRGVALSLDELGSLSQPVLFVWGDQDVFQTPAAAAASIVAIRDLRLLRLPTAGHAPWLKAEATVGGAVAAHLAA